VTVELLDDLPDGPWVRGRRIVISPEIIAAIKAHPGKWAKARGPMKHGTADGWASWRRKANDGYEYASREIKGEWFVFIRVPPPDCDDEISPTGPGAEPPRERAVTNLTRGGFVRDKSGAPIKSRPVR